MIPVLYANEEKNFVTNGLGRLSDCISCVVTEERNGIYECEFVYPLTGERFDDIVEGCIIYCTHDETGIPQPFEIYGHTAPIDGKVTFYAHHISYKLNKLVVMPFTAVSCVDAMSKIVPNTATPNAFAFWTDKSTDGNFAITEPRTIRGLLGGQEGSLLDIYGKGEYEWDKYTVKLHLNRGSDSGVEIRYGKNLVDLKDDVDAGEVYNAIVPYWKASDDSGEIVTLPEKALVYSEATKRIVDLTDHFLNILRRQDGEPLQVAIAIEEVIPLDLSQEFSEQPTVEQLREKARARLESSGGWDAKRNIEVDFVALWQTEEYKEFAPLQRVRLCDTVSVFYPELNVEAVEKKVVKTTYNVLLDRYDKIELGDLQYSFSDVVAQAVMRDVPSTSIMQSAIENATRLITGGLGGHVYIKPNADGYPEEILIMDDSDYTQATKLWRWNINGLGYSDTGYNGTYGTAITMDGEIVADYITAGTLDANIVDILGYDSSGSSISDANDVLNKVKIGSTGMTVEKDGENVAFFGETARIGAESGMHQYMDYHSLQMIDIEGDTFFHVSDLRDETGVANVEVTIIADGTDRTYGFAPNAKDLNYTVNVSDGSGGSVTKRTNAVWFETAPTDGAAITIRYTTTAKNAKAYTCGLREENSTIGCLSFCEGLNSSATGYCSHAEGFISAAHGEYSHAEGQHTKSRGTASHSEGYRTEAKGQYSHAEGQETLASGIYSHAEGQETTASSYGSHAEGSGTTASYPCSHAEGEDTTSSARCSHAEGRETTASGSDSHAEGFSTVATGYCSHAEGISTQATQTSCHAEGQETVASSAYAHAEGYKTVASGSASHAGGTGTIASESSQTVIGTYNAEVSSALFIIGNGGYHGGSSYTRKNAMYVDSGGNTIISGTLTQLSDKRLKEHIDYLSDDAIEFIQKLKPVHYIKDESHHVGFYAQDVEEVDKWDCMVGEMNGYKTLGYTELIAPLVAYCQSLERRIESLERSK